MKQTKASKKHQTLALNRDNAPCPCGRGQPYAACCALWHQGKLAPDAETLMRSRYTAYVFGLVDYLRATWDIAHCPSDLADVADNSPPAANHAPQWLGLEVKKSRQLDSDHAEVEFVARYRVQGRAYRLHETSQFRCDEGRWLYINGTIHE